MIKYLFVKLDVDIDIEEIIDKLNNGCIVIVDGTKTIALEKINHIRKYANISDNENYITSFINLPDDFFYYLYHSDYFSITEINPKLKAALGYAL